MSKAICLKFNGVEIARGDNEQELMDSMVYVYTTDTEQHRLEDVYNSKNWKLTAPLRKMFRFIKW